MPLIPFSLRYHSTRNASSFLHTFLGPVKACKKPTCYTNQIEKSSVKTAHDSSKLRIWYSERPTESAGLPCEMFFNHATGALKCPEHETYETWWSVIAGYWWILLDSSKWLWVTLNETKPRNGRVISNQKNKKEKKRLTSSNMFQTNSGESQNLRPGADLLWGLRCICPWCNVHVPTKRSKSNPHKNACRIMQASLHPERTSNQTSLAPYKCPYAFVHL